ncbi:MAG: hypothetical protein ACYTFG_14820 [Planctomycetota bacterium]
MTRPVALSLLLVGALLVPLSSDSIAGASADEWAKIKRDALTKFQEGNKLLSDLLGSEEGIEQYIKAKSQMNMGPELKDMEQQIKEAIRKCVKAIAECGPADCSGAVDLLVKLIKMRSPAEESLLRRSKDLEKKIEAIYARNKAMLKKNMISRNDQIEAARLNQGLSAINKTLNFLTAGKRKASEAFAQCKSQVDYMTGKALKDRDWLVRMEVLQGLATIGTEPAHAAVKEAVQDKDSKVRTEALDLCLKNNVKDMDDLFIDALLDDWWQVRSIAIRAIRERKIYAAVGALVDALQVEDGRLTLEIDDALKMLTGKRYYGDAELWARWWAVNKEKFEKEIASGKAPASAPAAQGEGAAGAGGHKGPQATVSFYGIKTASKRIIFILDISGSMREKAKTEGGPSKAPPTVTGGGAHGNPDPAARFKPKDDTKIEVAKCELKRAICNLKEDAVFNIVFYNHEVEVYKKGVVKATKGNKEAAYRFVDGKQPAGNTNIHDSLKKGFDITMPEKGGKDRRSAGAQVTGRGAKKAVTRGGVDTVFFLTDGKPTAGQIVEPRAILAAVRLWNGTRKIQLHTIGIGDHDTDFLSKLASQNGGTYVKR